METTKALLTPEELAARLKVKPTTIRRWARSGAIPAKRIGGSWRFDWDAVMIAVEMNQGRVRLTAFQKRHSASQGKERS